MTHNAVPFRTKWPSGYIFGWSYGNRGRGQHRERGKTDRLRSYNVPSCDRWKVA